VRLASSTTTESKIYMTKDNVIAFPKVFSNSTALGIAEALADYVKDKPNAKIVVIINDIANEEITMGWNPMDAGELSLMLRFANYKWEQQTFRGKDSLYGDSIPE
jgi:hypothetical protein